MASEFIPVGMISLLAAMSPGPDFACVTKNTLLYSRRAGLFTTLGLCTATLIHLTYCILGIALLITQSAIVFHIIKILGALYLIYLGTGMILSKTTTLPQPQTAIALQRGLTDHAAFRQGFLCNILNPKAMLFFLSLFTLIINPNTPATEKISYAVEIVLITLFWFGSLTWLLSHPHVIATLSKAETFIIKLLGIFLVGFGLTLILIA